MQGGYVAVDLQSVFPDSVLLYDIYLSTKGSDTPVLYRRRNIKISADDLLKVASQGATLYVEQGDLARYRASVEADLPAIMSREDLPPQQKSAILYDCSTNLVANILREPRSKGVLERSQMLASTTAEFMRNESTALAHLQRVASKDYYTYTHSVDVMVFSIALAVRLGYDQTEFLNVFGQGALLHDLGKSNIDPRILNSPGKLTENEWKVMREHPVFGCRILDSLGRTEHVVHDVVRHHHEKMNGKGYPDGLEGKRVSRYARMVAIADVFDALTTRRPYKDALSVDDAIALMQDEMRGELDERYLGVFADMVLNREAANAAAPVDAAACEG